MEELSMATARKSLAERSLRWSKVSEKGADLTAEMPELGEAVDELRSLPQEVTALTAQQSHHMAQARILTSKIGALAKRADHVRGRIGASLRGKYGFDARELISYGFKPRKWVKKDNADRGTRFSGPTGRNSSAQGNALGLWGSTREVNELSS
jgi:hypothetical protein